MLSPSGDRIQSLVSHSRELRQMHRRLVYSRHPRPVAKTPDSGLYSLTQANRSFDLAYSLEPKPPQIAGFTNPVLATWYQRTHGLSSKLPDVLSPKLVLKKRLKIYSPRLPRLKPVSDVG